MTYKKESYYSNIRIDLIGLITKRERYKVLEIGAGFGETLFFLKERGKDIEAVGVDLNHNPSKEDLYKRIDNFMFGDIEKLSLDEYENYFDVIILADVLEHLKNPSEVLKKLKTKLKNDGEIISSMPNIRNLYAFKKIFIKGSFSYETEGLFDNTHLRFFCKNDMVQLFKQANFKVAHIESALKKYRGKSLKKTLNIITFGIFEEFLSPQYYIRAKNE